MPVVVASLAAVILVGGGAILWLHGFAHSPAAADLVAGRIAEAMDGEASLDPLAWGVGTVSSPRLSFRGNPSSHIAKAEASLLRATVPPIPLLLGKPEIPLLAITEASINVRGTATEPPPGTTATQRTAPAGRLGNVVIERLRVEWERMAIEGMETNLLHDPFDGTWSVDASGGTLAILPSTTLAIDSLAGRIGPSGIAIHEARLTAGTTGIVVVRGSSGSTWHLEWKALDKSFLPLERLPETIRGRFGGSASIMPDHSATGRISMEEGAVTDIPRIPGIPGTLLPRTLPLTLMEADFAIADGRTALRNVRVHAGGILRAEGALDLGPDDTIAGRIELGIAPALADSLPGAERLVFKTRRDGFLWTPVTIGGTLDSPSEDLTARLAAMVTGGALLDAAGDIGGTLPGEAGEAARDLIDSILPLLQ